MDTMKEQAKTLLIEGNGFFKPLEQSLSRPSKFNNELLYQMSAMSFEKFMVALLAHHNVNAEHHTPMALVNEAKNYETIPDSITETGKLIGKFESICSLSGFGYKMPDNDELKQIIVGLVEVKQFVYGKIEV